MRPARFALEVDDENVVLDDQHLAEMEIAVVADAEAVDIRRKQRAQALMQGGLLGQQQIDELAIGFPETVAPLLEHVEHALGAARDIVDAALDLAGRDRLRREIGDVVAAREREMHFGDAPSGLRHIAQIGNLFLALAGVLALRQQTLFIDEAIEIGRCHGPAVTLVLDKGMDDRDRALALVVTFDQFDAAEQRRRVGEARDFGQEAADLDLGIDAGLELAIELHHIVVVHQRRAVGLLGFDGADVIGLPDRLVGKPAGRPEFKPQVVFLDGQGFAEVAQQQRDEDLVGGDVEQGAFARSLAYRGEGAGVVALAVEPHPFDLHRQHVARGDAALGGLEKCQPGPVVADVAERDRRGQGGLNGLGRTLRIPARARQIAGQHIAFEHAPGTRERHPGGADRHDQGLELGNHRRRDVFRLVGLAKLEPVEAIRRQRNHIGQLADRRKVSAPEHLQRDTILPRRKVELGGLRRARQVGDAKDHLVAILPDIGQHAAVDRTDEGHGAAAERQCRLSHRDQPLGRAQQRRQAARLRLDIDRLVAIDRIHDGRGVEPGRVGAGEAAIAVRRPLHRRAHAIAVAEIDVVPHPDLVAVIDDRRTGE